MPSASNHRLGRAPGFSLVELIVTMMLISVAVVGITNALSFAFSHQSDGLWQARAIALAEAYVEEIMARRYDETTPPGGVPPCAPATTPCSAIGSDGETRAEFDDVDDYHGLDEQPPLDGDGNPRIEYASYRVQVSVAYASAAQVATYALNDPTDAKVVTVSVSPPGQSPLNFTILRSNF